MQLHIATMHRIAMVDLMIFIVPALLFNALEIYSTKTLPFIMNYTVELASWRLGLVLTVKNSLKFDAMAANGKVFTSRQNFIIFRVKLD